MRTHLYRISGVDFTQVDGFGALSVLILFYRDSEALPPKADRMLKNLKKKAQAFGLELIPISTPTECVS